jgi:hypothetical protein
MHVVTRNVSFDRAFLAEGQSRYTASSSGHTDFSMHMAVTAWAGALSSRCPSSRAQTHTAPVSYYLFLLSLKYYCP